MSDKPPPERANARPSLRPTPRSDALLALLEQPLTDETKVLDALVGGLATGEATLAHFKKLHAAAAAADRAANLSFSYERLSRDPRIKILPRPRQAEFFLAAADFFGEAFGDLQTAVSFGERAYQAAPDDPEVFDQLETLLATSQDGTRLAQLYLEAGQRAKEPPEKLRLFRAAVELLEAYGAEADALCPALRHIVDLDPSDRGAADALEKQYVAARRFRELAETLERSLTGASPDPAVRLRLIGLYRGELRDPVRAAPHAEALLAADPPGAEALQAAEALVDHRAVTARVAPALAAAYRRLRRVEDEATTLALELKVARPPRLAEVQRRLAVLRQDSLGDPAGALELLEPLVARDPSDDELRRRFLAVSATFHREVEAAKLLVRSAPQVRDAAGRVRVGLDLAELHHRLGDARRARAALEPLVEEAPDDATRLALHSRLVALHADGTDTRALAASLEGVVRLCQEQAPRLAAARRLAELCDAHALEPRLAIVAHRALVASPRAEESLDRLEALCAATGDAAGQIEVLEQRLARAVTPDARRPLAFRLAEARAALLRDPAQVAEVWRAAISADGGSVESLGRLAEVLERLRAHAELAEVLAARAELLPAPERAAALARVARLQAVELASPERAVETLRRALSADPREPAARRLGERLLAEGTARAAAALLLEPLVRREDSPAGLLAVLEARIETSADDAARLVLLEEAHALSRDRLGDSARALGFAGQALAVAARGRPEVVGEWLVRFRDSARRAGDAEATAALLARATDGVAPTEGPLAELVREGAEARRAAGDAAGAIAGYRRLLEAEPSSPELLARLDELLAEQGSPEERLALQREALGRERSPERRLALLRAIARIVTDDLGDPVGGVAALRAVLAEVPEDVAAHEALVALLARKGDREGVRAEIERALPGAQGRRRIRLLAALAVELEAAQSLSRAAEVHRELADAEGAEPSTLEAAAAFARRAGDAALELRALERLAQDDTAPPSGGERHERMGVLAAAVGDVPRALSAFREAARHAAPGDAEGRLRLETAILDLAPGDSEAAGTVAALHADAGRFQEAGRAVGALIGAGGLRAAVDVILGLEARAVRHAALEEFAAMVDEALGALGGDVAHRTRELHSAKARVLASQPARRLAGATFRGLIEIHGDEADVEGYQRYLAAAGSSPDVVDELRWLCRYRAEHDADPRRALDEWVDLEEHRAHDTGAAAAVLERILDASPADEGALDRLVALRTARGEAAGLVGLLGRIAEQLDAEGRGRVALRLARLFAGPLGRSADAVAALREVLARTPDDREALALLSGTLPDPAARPDALELIGAVVTALDRAAATSFLERLLARTSGDATLGPERARWAALLIERLDDEPARALDVAVAAAAEAPEDRAVWELAERLARRAENPAPVFATYRRALDDARTPERAESIGRRYVDFHEEWAEDAETVLPLLERVLAASPRARWALDRIKLAYNAEGRWQDLFALYDRAIDAATDDPERIDVLDEAAVAAKDLANDAERAATYLERRLALAPDPRGEAMLERLYERTGRSAELLAMLERRLEGREAKDTLKLETRIARLKLDLGDIGGAFERVERVLRSSPDERAAYTLLEALVRAPRRPSAPPQGGGKKGKRKKVGRDVREESLKLLEQRYRATGDREGLVRVIEVVLELEPDRADGRARLEELVDLAEQLGDDERAFTHLSALVALAPADVACRRRLADVAARLEAPERRVELLARVASAPGPVAVRRELLRELADAALETGDAGRAADALLEVLSLAGDDPAGVLEIARRVEPLLGQLDRQEEQCDALECIAQHERDPRTRGEVLARAADLAFFVLGDVDRAARAHRARLADSPRELDALAGLEGIYAAAERWRDLAEVLSSRAALLGGERARDDRVRVARLLSTRIGDLRGAIDAWRAIVRDFGPAADAFEALCELLAHEGRHAELGALLTAEAALRPPGEARREIYRRLADLRRERLGDPAGAVDALFSAGDVDRAIEVVEAASGRAASRAAAAALLELAAAEWSRSPSTSAPALARAVLAAVDALVLRHQDDGEHAEILALRLRVAELPFEPLERRRLRRDAAWVAADQLRDGDRARGILAELFAEDPADEVAAAAVARYARLLGEAEQHAPLAAFWEEQARVRSEGGDRVAAAALLARAAEIHELKLGDVGSALADHRAAAALGGESSLEAIARIELARRRPLAAVDALEWLVAGSSREELGPRALLLADAYLAVGEWDRARARLEAAAGLAVDGGAVRARLSELYRRHREWDALAKLLVAESERASGDAERLALLREAAQIHAVERGDAASAIPLLARAVELDPEETASRIALAEALSTCGRHDEATAVLREQVERYGTRRPKVRALVHLHLARVALAAGRRAEAIAELDSGTRINPAHPGILHEFGRLALEEGQLARAEKTFRALLLVLRKPDEDATAAPSRAEVYLDLGEIAARQGDADRAAELVESAFDAALENAGESAALERALRRAGRLDLLARAVETRLASAADPAVAARALSDLVLLEPPRVAAPRETSERVKGEVRRIHRDLDGRDPQDPTAWAALGDVYAWLGDEVAEGRALEAHLAALPADSAIPGAGPLLRLAALRLRDSARLDEGVELASRALSTGARAADVRALVREASGERPTHPGVLSLLEQLARVMRDDRALVEAIVDRAQAGDLDAETAREGVELARRRGDRAAEIAIVGGVVEHGRGRHDPEDARWAAETLARRLLEEGRGLEASRLLEQAARAVGVDRARGLVVEAARLATDAGELARAAALYEERLALAPGDREAWEPLLDVRRRLGDRDGLLTLIRATEAAVTAPVDRARLRLEEVSAVAAEPERAAEAIPRLRQIVAEDPGLVAASSLLADLLATAGRDEELAELLAVQIDQAKDAEDATEVERLGLRLGSLLERRGDHERAVAAYEGVLAWTPSSRDALAGIVRVEERRLAPAARIADALERLAAVESPEAARGVSTRLVELRAAEGDAEGIERALELACAAAPEDAPLREQLVSRYLERSEWSLAARVLVRAARAHPEDAALVLRAVEAAEQSGDIPGAAELIGLAMRGEVGDAELHAERARLLGELGRHDEALRDIEAAHERGGGRTAELLRALEAAAERADDETRASHVLRLVGVLETTGETTQARDHLVKLVRQQPKHRIALRRLGALAAIEARWDEAAATYRRLIPLEEGEACVAAALDLADACEHAGHLADARGGLELALERVPTSSEVRARLRCLYEDTQAHRELAALLLDEARAEPEVAARAATLVRVAELLLERVADPAAAVRVLEEARRLSPESIPGAVLLARAHASLGRAQEARTTLEEVVAAHRGRRTRELSSVYREIANLALESGQLRTALDSLSRAFDLDMRSGELAMQLGHLALDVSDDEAAQKAFRAVTMMKPRQAGSPEGSSPEAKAVAYYHLARIARAQGDVRKARLMISKAVSENPSHAEAQALLRELRAV